MSRQLSGEMRTAHRSTKLSSDTATLVHREIALARAELTRKAKKTGAWAGMCR